MTKVRINDLARELEVKSNAILDALKAVGVTETKTHSSSITEDEAVKVRGHFSRGTRSAAPRTATPEKPRFDLSNVSKPGDALKAILERKQAEAAAKAAPPPRPVAVTVAPPPPGARPVQPAAPLQARPVVAELQPAPAPSPVAAPQPDAPAAPAPRRIVPIPRPPAPSYVVAPPAARVPAAPRPAAPAVASTPPAAPVVVKPSEVPPPPPVVVTAVAAAAPEPVPAPEPESMAPAEPATPVRRVVMPQTGPRPTYTAPPGSARTPIFQRPRPGFPGQGAGAPGARPGMSSGPGMAPGARRPMHPTRTFPGGTGAPGSPGARPGFAPRPGFGARPGFPGARPGGPGGLLPPTEAAAPGRPARPAQRGRGGAPRYEKNKEVALKGYRPGAAQIPQGEMPITKSITVTEGISVKDLAEKLDVRGKDLIATLLMKGVMVTVNQSLDGELVKEVSRQFGADATIITVEDQLENEAIEGFLADTSNMVEVVRAPVVTIMGHVDHGKTSLLDAIRSTEFEHIDVASGEAGGITQHIGAYKVHVTKPDSPAFGREIVFLDTPGHEAFTRMRARGAKVTDIVVVVVAADDGVMPQTLEAIDHAKAAKVPIIVAVNKIDKPDADPTRVMQQLAARGVQATSMGGDTEFVEVSAKKRLNLDALEEMILLVADTNEQKSQPERPAVGTVIEAKLDRGRGAVASILVQNGTLRIGDSYIVGDTFGKVRAMFNDRGVEIREAGPSTPVEILGLESMPDAGDTFLVMADRDKAKGIAQYRKMKAREAQLAKSSRVSLEGLAEQIKQAGVKDLNLILKGDVQGSVEVLADSLSRMSTEKVRVKVLHSGVGAITESDVLLASASNAVVIGFSVKPDRKAQDVADRENVEIRLHSIIYELQDQITKAMYGLLDAVYKENYAGRATVLQVFKITKVGQIAGCQVTDGLIKRDAQVRVLRDDVEVWKGKIASLKRVKEDVAEVRQGVECGIDLAGFKDIKAGDIIEAFTTEKLADELGRNSAEARKERDAEALKAAKDAEREIAKASETDAARAAAEEAKEAETANA
jgi:translation initiation factor IF-2